MEFALEFEWDMGNLEHAQGHGVSADEIEEAFNDKYRCVYDAHSGNKKIIGMSEEGRLVVVIYKKKGHSIVRPITSWDATNAEKAAYNKRRR